MQYFQLLLLEGCMWKKQYRVELTDTERAELLLLTRRGTAPAREILRAHILLRASEDALDPDTAEALHTSVATVQRVRQRFADGGLARALHDRHRPGAAPKLDAKGEAQLIAIACSAPPEGRAVWTLQLLADKLVELHVIDAISDESVRRTLGKKSAQALEKSSLVHGKGRRRLRLAHGRPSGGRTGSLHRSGHGA